MKMRKGMARMIRITALGLGCAGGSVTTRGEGSFCAEVQMVIEQTLTLERQAFDAHMRIRNGIRGFSLDQINIEVTILDTNGNAIAVTTNAQDTNALFFIRVDRMENVDSISGAGVIAAETTADIHWLIIPSASAGGATPAGVRYQVGANLSYSMAGDAQTVGVAPDSITVKPMPMMRLDYFLPYDVYADDPFTPAIEAPVPFSLGVRVKNTGRGDANALKIESGQPRIVENTKGLLIGFEITDSEVQGVKSAKKLEVDFGTLKTSQVKVARWTMECSLSGHFTSFNADFAHSDALGGELTSLIQAVNTHTLVHDVLVDLPGRDRVRDFLAQDSGAMKVYESENYEVAVTNLSADSDWEYVGASGGEYTYLLTTPASAGPLFAKMVFDEGASRVLVRVVRSDGKGINLANAWVHKERERQEDPWQYFFCLFDTQAGGEYSVVFRDKPVLQNEAPVLQYIGTRVTRVGEPVDFLVRASDPNETIPELAAQPLPVGAAFSVTNGSGTFLWLPGTNDYGVHLVRFSATDGQYTDWEVVKIYVGHAGESLCNGVPCSLAEWRVTIKDLVARTSSANATVLWDSVAGVPYEMYYSDQPFASGMTWSRSGSSQTGVGAEQSAADGDLGVQRERRFYRLVVAGDSPDTNGVWGVIRRPISSGYTMMAPPLAVDRAFNGGMGAALAEVLTGDDGGLGDGVGDEVYVLQANGMWRALYLDSQKVWREASGTASTYNMPAGLGFFLVRRSGTGATVTFSGPVGNTGTSTNRLVAGWNLIGPSEGKDLPLKATLAGANPRGADSEEQADQLVMQNADGSWRRLMYVQGWGAPYDGNWFDLRTFQIVSTNEMFRPGEAYYYYRQPSAGETDLRF